MRIERITEISEILKCLPYEREIRNKNRDTERESKMLSFIQLMLPSPLFGFWIAYEDNDEIIGYVSAMLNPLPGFERLHLLRVYAKNKTLHQEFEDLLKEWAKPFKIKIAQITAKCHVKSLQRKFGFIPVSVNMEKDYFPRRRV